MSTIKTNDDFWESREPAVQEVLNTARIVAAAQVTTLILGESGTGKALLARAIHTDSPRRNAPIIAVNCGALPNEFAESLLFGYDKNTTTHAQQTHDGYIRAASGGTLFLDEVDELSLAIQAKLLRLLESGEIIPVGKASPLHADVRIVAATHRDLAQLVADGKFRDDLYYRLNVVPLCLPALRERTADIPSLLKHFFEELAAQHNQPPVRLDSGAMHALKQYSWPGNIRELRNLCERLAILMPGKLVGLNNLPTEYRKPDVEDSGSLINLPNDGLVLADVERDLIQQALTRTRGNRSKAARLLGLTRDTLLYRLKKFALN